MGCSRACVGVGEGKGGCCMLYAVCSSGRRGHDWYRPTAFMYVWPFIATYDLWCVFHLSSSAVCSCLQVPVTGLGFFVPPAPYFLWKIKAAVPQKLAFLSHMLFSIYLRFIDGGGNRRVLLLLLVSVQFEEPIF